MAMYVLLYNLEPFLSCLFMRDLYVFPMFLLLQRSTAGHNFVCAYEIFLRNISGSEMVGSKIMQVEILVFRYPSKVVVIGYSDGSCYLM